MSNNTANAKRPWTPEQTLGIETIGCNLLVSAAAGSGKTAVLAERCAHLVCHPTEPCDVDELLVVTFTDAAAAEMRSRIASAIRSRAASSPSERLDRQLALVEQAQVSTIHSFCTRLLRQHFHRVGLDPGFRVMDADEAALLRKETARQLFEDYYEQDDGRFALLIDSYGQGQDDGVLDKVVDVHDLLASVVDPEDWICRSRRRITQPLSEPFDDTELGKELIDGIRGRLKALINRCDVGRTEIESLGVQAYAEYAGVIADHVTSWYDALEAQGIDALSYACKSAEWPKLPTIRNKSAAVEAARSIVDDLRDEAKKGSWTKLLSYSAADWRESLMRIAELAGLFLDLVAEFGVAYRRAKDQAHSLDFADLERFALAALCDGPPSQRKPSDAARSLRLQFAHVLVDEYQDINEVQDAILSLVSRDKAVGIGKSLRRPNLFCVGDVKQSIYGFRLAEPKRFLDRRSSYLADSDKGTVIDLSSNFRSRKPLLDAVNSIFARLMTEEAVDIEYDQSQRLIGALEYPKVAGGNTFAGSPIELHILPLEKAENGESDQPESDDEPLDRAEREAALAAFRIRQILGLEPGSLPMHVMERAGDGTLKPRPARASDIVILLRSIKFKAEQYARILQDFGIRVHADITSGYFESMEVRDIMALLRLLDNQQQDIPLAAVLRSPLARLNEADTCLVKIRAAFPSPIPFHAAVVRYSRELSDPLAAFLRAFFAQLDSWRASARRDPVADVIWTILHDTGYLTYVAALHRGQQRRRNLLELHRRADQFGKFQTRGLSRFMRFLDQLQHETDLGQPSTASEADDVVRIMSVHRSKGLEFPIVILPDLGKRINLASSQGSILADRAAGFGMKAVDVERRIRYPSLSWAVVEQKLTQQTLAEEMRILYVALTRAREHMILLGTCPIEHTKRWKTRWQGFAGQFPTEAILGAKTMLDWIGPVSVAVAQDAPPVFQTTIHSAEECDSWKPPGAKRVAGNDKLLHFAQLKPLDAPATIDAAAQAALTQIAFVYPYDSLARSPAFDSVTRRTHKQTSASGASDAHFAAPSLVELPAFIEPAAVSATARGVATHLVLQHMNFDGPCNRSEIDAQIDALVGRKAMTETEAQAVDRESIIWLLNSEMGPLLRSAPRCVKREIPVNFPYPPELTPDTSPLDRTMIRGRIDVLILTDQVNVLLDYKTDSISLDQVAERAESYRPQVEAYRSAIERITARKIHTACLAFLHPRKLVKFDRPST